MDPAHTTAHHLPSREDFQILADVFRLLDDPTRLNIFLTLCHGEDCVISLASRLNISSPALAHHLKLLRDGGLITSRRSGKEVYYTAADTEEVNTLHHAIEQIMKVSCPMRHEHFCRHAARTPGELSGQEQVFLDIHDYLIAHLDQRITIEELSHRFLMNTTTLKNGFKALYGTSIAAHIKEHRLEAAAGLLAGSDKSVHEIAVSVGYTSQSKFSSSFYERYQCYPLDYRKTHRSRS